MSSSYLDPAQDRAPRALRLTLGAKLIAALVATAAIGAVGVGLLGWNATHELAEQDAGRTLAEVAADEAHAVKNFFGGVKTDLAYLASTPKTAEAVSDLTIGWNAVKALGAPEVVLQRGYITANPHPVGEKHRLDRASGDTAYDRAHAQAHPMFRSFLEAKGYYDIFLISANGDVVYSVFKERDFATNVSTGALRDSGLGQAFAKARTGAVAFADFEPYAPSADAPAAFVAAPVRIAGEIKAVVVVQVPSDKLAKAIEREGSAVSSFVVGADGLLRSDLPNTPHDDLLKTRFTPPATLTETDADALFGYIDAGLAHAGPALVAIRDVEILGVRWSVVTEETTEKAFAPVQALVSQKIIFVGVLILLAAIMAAFLARSFVRPLRALGDAVRSLRAGASAELAQTGRSDEIGELAREIAQIQDMADDGARARAALDCIAAGVIIADVDLNIVYANPFVRGILEPSLPYFQKRNPNINVSQLVGQNIDIFHKDPSMQRGKLKALETAHEAEIGFDDRIFGFRAAPVRDSKGKKIGFAVVWEELTAQRAAEKEINAVIESVAAGDLAKRVAVRGEKTFVDKAGVGLNAVCEVVEAFVTDVDRGLGALARGDLKATVPTTYKGRFGEVASSVNGTASTLAGMVGDIKSTAVAITGSTDTVANGASDLATRAESQASSLQETAATMEEISATVSSNAESATMAQKLSADAQERAGRGQDVVSSAVKAMGEIEESSTKITDIIAVIDSIAFQTNLLALNAAVEAARAGDAGKGFAVVASEVRTLAQRSGEAARDIKDLITVSAAKVSDGVELVKATGGALTDIADSISKVGETIEHISTASREQANGVAEITSAVSHMDQATQSNSSLAEQSASTARTLAGEATRLQELMAFFQIDGETRPSIRPASSEAAADAAWTRAARADDEARPSAPPRAARAAAAADEEWASF